MDDSDAEEGGAIDKAPEHGKAPETAEGLRALMREYMNDETAFREQAGAFIGDHDTPPDKIVATLEVLRARRDASFNVYSHVRELRNDARAVRLVQGEMAIAKAQLVIAKAQLWIGGAVALFALVQLGVAVLEYFKPDPKPGPAPVVVCADRQDASVNGP